MSRSRSGRSIAATGLLAAVASTTFGQGTGGRLPDPRSGPEVAAWLGETANLGDFDRDRRDAVWTAHENYLESVERLRDTEIEAWLEKYPEEAFGPPGGEGEDPGEALERAARQAASHRRLFERLAALEDAFWTEAAEAAGLDEAALQALRGRGVRARALDLQARRRFLGGVDPLDLAGLLDRLDATAEEERLVRERLADHDRRLAEALAVAVESEFESSIRRTEQRLAFEEAQADRHAAIDAEVAAASAEGRTPDLSEIMAGMVVDGLDVERPNARGANRLLEQQLESLERLRGAIADERLAFLLARLGHGGGDPLGRLFRSTIDEKVASGEIDAETAAAIDAIRAAYYRERVDLAIELARLEGSGSPVQVTMIASGVNGFEPPEDRLGELRGRLAQDLPQQVRDRLAGLVTLEELERQRKAAAAGRAGRGGAFEVDGASGTVVFETIPAQSIEFGVATVVATVDLAEADGDGAAIAFESPVVMSFTAGEDGTLVLGAPRTSPPPLRPISRERLEAALADVALADDLRIVAEQIRIDAEAAFEAILRELEETLAADAEATRSRRGEGPGLPMALLGGGGVDLPRIDEALRRCLEVDRTMFESIETLLDAEAIERLRMWRDAREAELFAAVSGLRGGNFDPDLAGGIPPWEGVWPRLESIGIVLDATPEALSMPAARDLLADHLRRYRDAAEGHWSAMQTLVPAAREARRALHGGVPITAAGEETTPEELMAEVAARQDRVTASLSRLRQARARIATLLREDLERLEQVLPDDSRRRLHAAVRRAAWPNAVPSMPAIEAFDEAAALAAEDAALHAELDEIERIYLAESDRLFDMLETLEVQPRNRAVADVGGGFSPEGMRRWNSLSGRLRFRHGELDFEVVRALRDAVGPERAERLEWPRSIGRDAPTAERLW